MKHVEEALIGLSPVERCQRRGVAWSGGSVADLSMMLGRAVVHTAPLITWSRAKGSSSRISGEVTATTSAQITGKIITSVHMHLGDLNRSLLKRILKQVGRSDEQVRRPR
jgi:hypothetical protein